MIERIISGGQTGADQGGLLAARDLGISTGGYAPYNYMTESGPARALLQGFGLAEAPAKHGSTYTLRTKMNVRGAHGTVIFGHSNSPGSRLTLNYCHQTLKPCYDVQDPAAMRIADIVGFRAWLVNNKVRILNVAGNRESRNPGIGEAARRFLVHALSKGDAA